MNNLESKLTLLNHVEKMWWRGSLKERRKKEKSTRHKLLGRATVQPTNHIKSHKYTIGALIVIRRDKVQWYDGIRCFLYNQYPICTISLVGI